MATAVTVLCTNGRRVGVRVSPSTVLLQVLEEACKKQKLDPLMHTLKHRGKAVDLNALFRYTNIPKNAHLEMVTANRSNVSSEVVLAVQCEDGSRRQEKFTDPKSTSLWDVLVKVGVVSDMGGREPVVVYMNSQVCGESDLRTKTLKDLGLSSGRAVVRLSYRQVSDEVTTPTQPVAMANTKSNDSSNETQLTHTSSSNEGNSIVKDQKDTPLEPSDIVPMETVATSDDDQPKPKPLGKRQYGNKGGEEDSSSLEYYFPAHPVGYLSDSVEMSVDQGASSTTGGFMEITPTLESAEPMHLMISDSLLLSASSLSQQHSHRTQTAPIRKQYDEPCDRERVVYNLDNSLPATPTEELPDDFFRVTHRDVHAMQEDLKKQVGMADAPLLTEAMRQAVKEKRYESYDRTILRVHLPDRWVLQGCFRPGESLKTVVKFVRDNLADPGLKFHLYTTPPKSVLKSGRPTLAESGFVPAAILYLGLEGEGSTTPLLSQDCLDCAQSALHAEMAVVGKRGSTPVVSEASTRPTKRSTSSSKRSSTGAVSAAIEKTIPKWFKTGK